LSVEEQEISALRRLGLTEYESRIYLVLIKMGPVKASELSFFGQIPRTKTYGAIKELERKGLLRTVPGKPDVYSPASPTEVLMPIVSKLNRDLADAEGVVQALALTYESMKFTKREGPKEAEEFWQLDGRAAIINKLNQAFTDATNTINYATGTLGLIRAYKAHSETFDPATARGVQVRMIAPVTAENSLVARELSELLDFRVLDRPFGENYVTVDSRELVVVESKPEDIRTDQGMDKAIWTANRLLVQLHDQLFERVWNSLPPGKFPSLGVYKKA
jgi:sugar-specific transcriptional regulator TrmB